MQTNGPIRLSISFIQAAEFHTRSCPPQIFDLASENGRLAQLWHDRGLLSAFSAIVRLTWDLVLWCGLLLRPRESLEAEILFLRRQLALYRERGAKSWRVDRQPE